MLRIRKTNAILAAQSVMIEDDADDDDEVGARPYSMFVDEKTTRSITIYLSKSIGTPAGYDELCHMFRSLSEGDTVRLYLNTTGGNVAAGLAMIEAMRDSQATITTILNPEAFSMGALLFLAGDDFEFPPNGRLMLHNYSSGSMGKGNEQMAEVQSSIKWFEQVMTDTCYPFISKAEIHAIIEGRDLWLTSDSIRLRFENLEKLAKQALKKPKTGPKPLGKTPEII